MMEKRVKMSKSPKKDRHILRVRMRKIGRFILGATIFLFLISMEN